MNHLMDIIYNPITLAVHCDTRNWFSFNRRILPIMHTDACRERNISCFRRATWCSNPIFGTSSYNRIVYLCVVQFRNHDPTQRHLWNALRWCKCVLL